ncbi:MAG: DEAD/DEAH box helicase [Candidatus Bathyarchaeota archaeon]|nr:DEAD/DEAH box helicase [Candidatus Bathyarchaeota archaeon]
MKCPDETLIVPRGLDIFQAEYRDKKIILGQEIDPPSREIASIFLSKYPLKLVIAIKTSDDQKKGLLRFELRGTYQEKIVTIKEPLDRIADHIVFKDVWYAFESESLESFKKLCVDAKISKEGYLTLQQMFYLLQNPLESIPVIIDFDVHSIPNLAGFEEVPVTFTGKLYPYQNVGYRWLCMIYKENLGCILGDEMGLGKTIQIICLIARNVEKQIKPTLVVAPATLLENWKREFAKFAPSIATYIHLGSERTGFPSDLEKYDVIITSFSTLIRDSPLLKLVCWDIIVADEAQAIKNPEAERTVLIKSLPKRAAIAVTGTPVQNSLTDLWSIMDFAIPGLLGERANFEKRYKNSIEGATNLEPLVTPVILRRSISEVAKDLPPRIDIPQPIEMTSEMAMEYERIRQEIIEQYGEFAQLVSLQKLRMFCAHPSIVSSKVGISYEESPKYQRLLEIVEEILDNKEQVLVFTSFTDMVDILVKDLPRRFSDIWISWIDGRVPMSKRQTLVDEFNLCGKPAVLILNPSAAGTGLNLTAANHVIHYNLEWNPAVEDQASARAHRIGQKKPVTVHRLYFIGSVEEVINDRVSFKRDLAETTVKGVKGEDEGYSDILNALNITPLKK